MVLSVKVQPLSKRSTKLCMMSYQVICDVIRTPGKKNCNNISHKPTRIPIDHGAWSACRELDVVKTFVINKWKDFLLGSLYNEAIAKKRNSPFLNALTAFGEERWK